MTSGFENQLGKNQDLFRKNRSQLEKRNIKTLEIGKIKHNGKNETRFYVIFGGRGHSSVI